MMGYDHSRCALCKRPFSNDEIELKILERKQNAINSINKAKHSGKFFKRKRKVDPNRVMSMIDQGFKIREIAKILKASESTIYRSIAKEALAQGERGVIENKLPNVFFDRKELENHSLTTGLILCSVEFPEGRFEYEYVPKEKLDIAVAALRNIIGGLSEYGPRVIAHEALKELGE
jgi:Helix-turn-helix domain of resolvase